MQDEYGEPAYPARQTPHGLAKLIISRGLEIPFADLLNIRNRMSYFGRGADAWSRWRAYALSASFTRYLIESRGMEKFLRLYARRSGADQSGEISAIYGRPAGDVIGQWKQFLGGFDTNMRRAERNFNFFARNFR